jgi:DNA-binding response OmpR family regulator
MGSERIRILLVDDDRELTATVRGVLEAQGYEVLTANDGEEGSSSPTPNDRTSSCSTS